MTEISNQGKDDDSTLASEEIGREILHSREPETQLLTNPIGDGLNSTDHSTRRGMPEAFPSTEVYAGTYFGDYQILEEIARGGMGVVYKARHSKLDRIVAIKMILEGEFASKEMIARFFIEAQAAATLDHPGIVPVYEIGQFNGKHFFAMGFVEGKSLAEKISQGPLLPREAAELMLKITEAIEFAHKKKIIHRDLKPANILLDIKGEPKITDFGLARRMQDNSGITRTGATMGTPSYMPPEQISPKAGEVGPPADIYSLGAILYCMLTGRPPFQAATAMDTLLQVLDQEPAPIRMINRHVSPDLEAIAMKCLSKRADQRYSSAQELGEDLGRYLSGESVIASNSKWSNRIIQLVSRNRDDERLLEWSSIIKVFSLIVLCTESLIQFMAMQDQMNRILLIRFFQLAAFGGVLFWHRKIWFGSVHPAISQMLALWFTFFIACYLHVIIVMERKWLDGDSKSLNYFASYPSFSLFSGFLFSALGRQYWGGCYIIAAAFFLLAVIEPFFNQWSPLLFGIVWFSVLMVIARRLSQLANR